MAEFDYRPLDPTMGEAVARRTILRTKADGTLETWGDVADRVAYGNLSLVHDDPYQTEEYARLRDHIAQARLLTSGRHLQHGDAGQAQRGGECFTNCSVSPFSFLLKLLLLSGSGVGRAYDDRLMVVDWSKLPRVVPVLAETHQDRPNATDFLTPEDAARHLEDDPYPVTWHMVDDSREGWAKAIELLERMAFEGTHEREAVVLDFSAVRPEGSPIGGMQDRPSSGPVPLMQALRRITDLPLAQWPRWKQTLYVDHLLAEVVIVGGARRAARMATKWWRDPDILEFITIKKEGGLWSANNSVAVDAEFWELLRDGDSLGPDLQWEDERYVEEVQRATEVFDAIVRAQYYDGTGEPGFLNVHQLRQVDDGMEIYADGRFAGSERYQIDEASLPMGQAVVEQVMQMPHRMIVNPCVTADTWVQTAEGPRQVSELLDRPFTAVVDGAAYPATSFWSTGVKPILRLTTEQGASLRCTYNHKIRTRDDGWVEAGDLRLGDAILLQDAAGVTEVSYVTRLEHQGEEEVFDCSVQDRHAFVANGILVHNCGEVNLLLLGAFCTIGDWTPFFADTLEEAKTAAADMGRMLIRVNLMDTIFRREVDRTNRIGVGFTGIFEAAWKHFGVTFRDLLARFEFLLHADDETLRIAAETDRAVAFWLFLQDTRDHVQAEVSRYCEELGVAIPHTFTVVKPSGSVSKLHNLTEGAHLPALRQYLRWVQFKSDDPLVSEYEAKGYPTQRVIYTKTGDVAYPGMSIVGFPTRPLISTLGIPPESLTTASEASMEEQYQWVRLIEKFWLGARGSQVSYTAKFNKNETSFEDYVTTVRAWQPRVRCLSLMPASDWTMTREVYGYSPEEPLSEEEYEALVTAIQERVDEVVTLEELQCISGACPL